MHNLKALSAISLALILSLSLITTLLFSRNPQIVFAQNINNNINTTNIKNNNTNNNTNIFGRFLTFSNATSGVTVSYPSYWNLSQDSNNNLISLTSPLKTVGIKFLTVPFVNMSLDEFTARRILLLRENLINFNILSSRTQESLSGPIQMLVFTYGNSDNNNVSKVLQAWSIKDNKAYITTYFADAALFDTFLPTAEKILESFQVNGSIGTTAAANAASPTASVGMGSIFRHIFYVMIAGKTHPIRYNIIGDGNELNNISANTIQATLNINITSASSGVLTIELPRNLIDSKLPLFYTDDLYSVSLNGNRNTGFYEATNNQSRILSIDFGKGVQLIKIQGNRMMR